MQSLIKSRSVLSSATTRQLAVVAPCVNGHHHQFITNTNNQNNHIYPTTTAATLPTTLCHPLFDTQVRNGGKHLPAVLKGRRGWQKVIDAKKKKAVLLKKLAGVSLKKDYLIDEQAEKKWSPETPIELAYTKYMGELNQTRKRHSSLPVDEMIALSATESDLQYALRVWRVLSLRNIKFKPQTTSAMVKKFVELGDLESAFDLLMNAKVLRMPVDGEAFFFVIDQLLAAGDVTRAVQVFSAGAQGKFTDVTVDDHVLNRFVSAVKSVEGDQNEQLIKAVAPLGKVQGPAARTVVARAMIDASDDTKLALIEACKSVKNDESPLVVKLLQLAVLSNTNLSSQLEELTVVSSATEEVASE